ncbi:hypothetical protein [Antrihabitans cavernicola]|uniref:Small secreted hydrophilic protein n=1 Tax=Antrihabitans cavernicola TaxID=2495913 RepID=A0A5A7SCP1_9NOCA|nr:hypothetical protein [Spelaeibacter cavernicola]KAA0022363.1 hypothetical protein FOY51_15470 [Spelaeibacter cavernicola]
MKLKKKIVSVAAVVIVAGSIGGGIATAHALDHSAPAPTAVVDTPEPGDTPDHQGAVDVPEPGDTPDQPDAVDSPDQPDSVGTPDTGR